MSAIDKVCGAPRVRRPQDSKVIFAVMNLEEQVSPLLLR